MEQHIVPSSHQLQYLSMNSVTTAMNGMPRSMPFNRIIGLPYVDLIKAALRTS